MAKVRIVLRKTETLQNDKHPVYIRIYHKRATFIRLGELSATIDEWDEQKEQFMTRKKINPNYESDNSLIQQEKAKILKLINRYQEDKLPWSLNMLRNDYENEYNSKRYKDFLLKRIEELRVNEQHSLADNRQWLINQFEKYKPHWIMFEFIDVNYKFIDGLYKFWKEQGHGENSIATYMSTIRADLNLAISRGFGSPLTYPFSNKYHQNEFFEIDQLNTKTQKRFLPKPLLIKFQNWEFKNKTYDYAKMLYFFSFYAQGMSFIDMAELKLENIKTSMNVNGDTIRFIEYSRKKNNRKKGAKTLKIQITSQLEEYLTWFADNTTTVGDYVLPIVKKNYEGLQLKNHIKNNNKAYNKSLQQMTVLMDFPEAAHDITGYSARHSFAYTHKINGTSTDMISEMMSHADYSTTQIYLDDFDISQKANLNQSLLA